MKGKGGPPGEAPDGGRQALSVVLRVVEKVNNDCSRRPNSSNDIACITTVIVNFAIDSATPCI